MAKTGLLEASSLFSQLGRIRKRHSTSSPRNLSSKSGRGLVLLLVTIVCSLLLAGRLLWCFMYLFTGTGSTEVYVDRGIEAQRLIEEAEDWRAKGDEAIVRVWDGKLNDDASEDDWIEPQLLEGQDKVETEDDKEERLLEDDNDDKRAEIEEVWRDDKELIKQMAELANSETNENDVSTEEADVSADVNTEEAVPSEVDDESRDENEATAVKKKLPDAMAYLERLTGKLANTGKSFTRVMFSTAFLLPA